MSNLSLAATDEMDYTEYPDDFEEEEVDVAEIVCNARSAMEVEATNDSFREERGGQEEIAVNLCSTIKTLTEKCIGRKKYILIPQWNYMKFWLAVLLPIN